MIDTTIWYRDGQKQENKISQEPETAAAAQGQATSQAIGNAAITSISPLLPELARRFCSPVTQDV